MINTHLTSSVKNINNDQVIIYEGDGGTTRIQVRMNAETVWLTIDQMAELFEKSRSTINEHILNIYTEKELDKSRSMRKIGNSDFSTKPTKKLKPQPPFPLHR